MATKHRKSASPIIDELLERPYDFDFHQAVRIFEAADKRAHPLGETNDPNREAIRLASYVSHAFPPSDLREVLLSETEEKIRALIPKDTKPKQKKGAKQDSKDAEAIEQKIDDLRTLVVNFMGLAGVVGPLPEPYIQLLLDRKRNRDYAFADFLDLFNHRLIALHHRIRKKHNPGIQSKTPDQTLIGQTLMDLAGVGLPEQQNRLAFSDRSLLRYAGLFWQKARSSRSLGILLSDFFKEKVTIEQLKGRWFFFSDNQQTYIGRPGKNNILGHNAMLGGRVWVQDSSVTVRIGPLDFSRFAMFLKTGDAYQSLCDMVKLYLGPNMDFVINLVIKGPSIPESRLGQGVALGWTSWLKTKTTNEDDAQVWSYP